MKGKNKIMGKGMLELRKMIKYYNEIIPGDSLEFEKKYGNLTALLTLYNHLGGKEDLIPFELKGNIHYVQKIKEYKIFYELCSIIPNENKIEETKKLEKIEKKVMSFSDGDIKLLIIGEKGKEIKINEFKGILRRPYTIRFNIGEESKDIRIESIYELEKLIYLLINDYYFSIRKNRNINTEINYLYKYKDYYISAEGINKCLQYN